MKLESLASLLGKDAEELKGTLNLAEVTAEVSDETILTYVGNHIKELRQNAKRDGKKEGEGMAKRLVMSEVEKTIKDSFSVEGKDFSEMLENLKNLKSDSKPDEKLLKQLDVWKTTATEKDTIISQLKGEIETVKIKERISSTILPELETFEFATPKVKQVAIDEFFNSNKFNIEGNDVFLERDNKMYVLNKDVIVNHFKDFGTIKTIKPNTTTPRPTSTSSGESIKEIMSEIATAKTPEEIQRLRQKLKDLAQN
jgi:hypothetical protein